MLMVPVIAGLIIPAGAVWPEASDLRMQEISRQTIRHAWPFAADKGTLVCMRTLGSVVVIFIPEERAATEHAAAPKNYFDNEYVHVSTDPFQLFLDMGKAQLFSPSMKIEDKITQLGPFVTLGNKLCDQPKGTVFGPGEL